MGGFNLVLGENVLIWRDSNWYRKKFQKFSAAEKKLVRT